MLATFCGLPCDPPVILSCEHFFQKLEITICRMVPVPCPSMRCGKTCGAIKVGSWWSISGFCSFCIVFKGLFRVTRWVTPFRCVTRLVTGFVVCGSLGDPRSGWITPKMAIVEKIEKLPNFLRKSISWRLEAVSEPQMLTRRRPNWPNDS